MQPRDKRVNSWRGGTTRSDNSTRSKALKNLLATTTSSFQPRTLSLAPTGQDKTRQDKTYQPSASLFQKRGVSSLLPV
jgi:hypothetical protein